MPQTVFRPRLPSMFLLLIWIGLFWTGCADNDPARPELDLPAGAIGPEGGTVVLAEDVVLYVPPGTVSGATGFHLAEALGVPSPPAGCVTFGRPLVIRADSKTLTGDVVLGLTFSYSVLTDAEGLAWLPVRLDRLAPDGSWQPVPRASTLFPLALAANLSALGTFAAHLDTTRAAAGEMNAQFILRSKFADNPYADGLVWSSHASVDFTNPWGGASVVAAGPVQVGNLVLESWGGGYYANVQQTHSILPGDFYNFQVPAGNGLAVLDQSVQFFSRELVLTAPTGSALTVDRNRPLEITWEGSGPDLVWLNVGYAQAEGWRGLTPNDGSFTISPEILATFAPGSTQGIFLQRTRTESLNAPGYDPASHIFLETTTLTSMVVP